MYEKKYKRFYAGYIGGSVCERGHKLRYEHTIKNMKTNEYKVLGVECVKHHFTDDKDSVTGKSLSKVFRRYKTNKSKLIDAIEDMFIYYNDYDDYKENCHYIYAINNYTELFTDETLGKANNYLEHRLPIPEDVQDKVISEIDKNSNYEEAVKLTEINKSKEKEKIFEIMTTDDPDIIEYIEEWQKRNIYELNYMLYRDKYLSAYNMEILNYTYIMVFALYKL